MIVNRQILEPEEDSAAVIACLTPTTGVFSTELGCSVLVVDPSNTDSVQSGPGPVSDDKKEIAIVVVPRDAFDGLDEMHGQSAGCTDYSSD